MTDPLRAAAAIEEAARDVRSTHRSDNSNWQPQCVTCDKAWPCDAEMLAELVLTVAALAQPVPDSLEPCQRCNRGNATWHAPSPLWNAVMRDPATGIDRYEIVCPLCFVDLAEEKGFRYIWHFGPHEDVTDLWQDRDGRTWDAERCLWVASRLQDQGATEG